MADTTIDLLKNSSYVGKMDELIAAVKSGGGTASDVEWDNVKNKPTTIGGYGIIDAKIDNGTITLGNQTITPLTSAPVTSVNSKTGAVTLSATDVSAIPSTLTGTAGQVLTKTADGQEWKDVDIPTQLPNPNALTFTGAVTGSYDGSAPLSVAIPSGGGGLTVTNTAAVGQTIKITAVDENGQPTEWEAVDFSSGGDAEKRVRHIATVSVTTETTSYSVTVDSNGNALNLESVYILTEKFWGTNGSYIQIKINGKELIRSYGQSGSPQVFELEKMGELQKITNIPKPSEVGISFGDYYNGKSAVTSVYFWSATSNVNTTIEIYGVDA